jgi:K+ potassium transporter C-terminal domain
VVDDLGYGDDGIFHVTIRAGYTATPNVVSILGELYPALTGGRLELERASFLLSRIELRPGDAKTMARWRKRLFLATSRLTADAAAASPDRDPRFTDRRTIFIRVLRGARVHPGLGRRRRRDQALVLYYAVSVFLSFLAGLIAMAVFSRREGRRVMLAVNTVAAASVGFTLVVNLTRGDPIWSLAASVGIAGGLYGLWVRAGRPRGIRNAAAQAATETDNDPRPDR